MKKRRMPWLKHCRKCGKFTSKNGRHDGTHKCVSPFKKKKFQVSTRFGIGVAEGFDNLPLLEPVYLNPPQEPTTPTAKQVDGDHYIKMAIQPWEIIEKNGLDYWEGSALKYLLRWKDKDGVIDLDKVIHCIEHIKSLALKGRYALKGQNAKRD